MYLIALLSLVLFVLVIILLSRVSSLALRLRVLEERMDRWGEAGVPSARPESPLSEGRPAAISPAKAVIPQAPAPAGRPSRTREEWEALIGGKVLNRIGAVALIIAVGLFLKYAFDQRLISETVRVLIGGAAGILALAGAHRTRTRGFEIFAQGLVGSGIAILYLSVYASFNFYHLVPQWVAFVLMGGVTALTLVQGVNYNSLAVALLGWAGGFLTPLMLSTGQSNEVGLFSYIALLDVGLLGILLVRHRWWVLEPLTFVATWVLYAAWYAEEYMPGDLLVTVFFILLFWGLFFGLDVLRLSREFLPSRLGMVIGAANALAAFCALYAIIDPDYHAWMGLVTLLFGAVYLLTFLAANARRAIGRDMEMQYVLTSVVLALLAAGIQFSGFEIPLAWSVLSGGIIWASRRHHRPYLFFAAAALLAVAFVKFFSEQDALRWAGDGEMALLLNLRSLALLALFGASLSSALSVAAGEGKAAQMVRSLLYYGAALSVASLVSLELNDVFRKELAGLEGDAWRHMAYAHVHTFAVVMALYTIPVLWVGARRHIHPFVVTAFAVLVLVSFLGVARGFLYEPIALYEPAFNVRVVALLILAVVGAWQARMLGLLRGEFRWAGGGQLVARMLVVVVLFTLVTGEVLDYFGRDLRLPGADEETRDQLGNLRQLSISGVWVFYSAALMIFGIWRKVRAIRIAAFALFGISILKIFIYDLSFLETLYRIFSFIALGVVLLAVSYAYQRFRHVIFGVAPPGSGTGS